MHSFELEKQLLAGLIKYPDVYIEISSFFSEDDFYHESTHVNRTIFSILKHAIESGEQIDYVIIADRVQSLGLSFEDNINISDYIQSLSLRKVNQSSLIQTAQELKKLTARRLIHSKALQIAQKMKSASSEESFNSLIEGTDQMYHDTINMFENATAQPENIFDDLEDWVEERGNNPIEEFGIIGPHKRINEMYGSLLRPGNITVITARSGVGKTQFCLDFCLKASQLNNNIPVLHFDNGEMSKRELQARLCSAMSGVPMHFIETGKWRRGGKKVVDQVRSVWSKVKNLNLHYFNVAGMTTEQMVSVAKRFYYSRVGRGNEMIFNFDYIKTSSEKTNKAEWQVVGDMVDRLKKLVQFDVLLDGEPMISLMTSVQSNRTGITRNRNSENIVEDESIVSLSDRIMQFSTHLFSLRQKTNDELLESPDFGTHKLMCFKGRHGGENRERAVIPVRMDDGSLRNNCIYLNFDNFNITEVGDLQDLVDSQSTENTPNLNNEPDNLPDI